MKERARVREEVRQIVRETFASSSDMALKLELVDTLQRIGVSYRYGEEIDELLRAVHRDARQHQEDRRDDDDHLYVTSLRFYLLRNHIAGGAGCGQSLTRKACRKLIWRVRGRPLPNLAAELGSVDLEHLQQFGKSSCYL